ncbi:zwei Ig domain protein zig-8-like [Toxorhynchites rutilus septentrionalis]|uniref:zwei Ig domain protein zig-8-like n=1 Tax=Toxorhynchites rutilus septentrionalis TaxID=329112 RepID=UPI00247876A2|nr:zwei Ig domain protein zig-8-like [Toxorhynchites rutilus septentrionalis]
MKFRKRNNQKTSELLALSQILYPMILLSVYVDIVGQVEASAVGAPDGSHAGVSFNTRQDGSKKEGLSLQHFGITSSPAFGSSSSSSGGGGGAAGSIAAPFTFPQLSPALSDNKPYFDDISPRNVTTVVDDTAVLKCRVKHKGNRTVSWMRKRDLHILTSSTHTYTGDQRFSVHHPPDSDDWDLKISYAQPRDSGIYECQVNTEPKINMAVYLHVTAARAKILGSLEAHVRKGSTISLSCVVNFHASSITWYHGTSIVNFDSARGGISLETEKTDAGTSSRLLLTKATVSDSGNYTCVPAGAIPASVQVYVLHGEHPAAMQTSGQMALRSDSALLVVVSAMIALMTIYGRTLGRLNDPTTMVSERRSMVFCR